MGISLVKRTITRDDVAREAGVSPATVSYVINNGPRPVTDETREKVLAAINKLGYQPNALARNLRMQKTNSIGLIIPDNKNTFFSDNALGVEQIAFDNGYNVIMCHSAYRLDRELAYIHMLISHQAAGVIWIPCSEDSAGAKLLESFHIPFVLLDRVIQGVTSPSIKADNFKAAYLATNHLVQLGHRRIGFIKRPVDLNHSIARLNGYKQALQDANIPFDPDLVVPGGFLFQDGSVAGRQLLSMASPPTAITAYNDMNTIGAMHAAQEMGIRIPEDLSFAGIDDIAQSEYCFPPLTTVRIPTFEMGKMSANLLIALIREELPEDQKHHCLDVELIVRESTAPPCNSK
ncbi:MAG TPA: LacI family DNA-binding transcriptional regulator [Anaerolineaceae bacterium]|jgi:LacI family transcriptional regulator|nr:LacI family DNA-binding transcriptional regulator [Anaerolineaceae bacterium]HOU44843.1 LacI family DNA-binding transcriptional regulator [Anaerolineaceae bacterium]HQF46165.1 LacI family DNA-binding transcriptional regulator [Anaerolineaceae bacterium]HQH36069.1 LacI family DNA-binding transcriptional regulator [Anaerolineaceae bacterium]